MTKTNSGVTSAYNLVMGMRRFSLTYEAPKSPRYSIYCKTKKKFVLDYSYTQRNRELKNNIRIYTTCNRFFSCSGMENIFYIIREREILYIALLTAKYYFLKSQQTFNPLTSFLIIVIRNMRSCHSHLFLA